MQEVELLDGAAAPEPSEPSGTAAARRWRWWAGAVASCRARARRDPVVGRPARTPPRSRAWPPCPACCRRWGTAAGGAHRSPQDEAGSLWGGIDTGAASAASSSGTDGSQAFTAVDTAPGRRSGTTPLLGPDPVRAARRHRVRRHVRGRRAAGHDVRRSPRASSPTGSCASPTTARRTLVPATTTRGGPRRGRRARAGRWPVEAARSSPSSTVSLVVGHRDAGRGRDRRARPADRRRSAGGYTEPLVEDPTASSDATTEHFWPFFAAGDVVALRRRRRAHAPVADGSRGPRRPASAGGGTGASAPTRSPVSSRSPPTRAPVTRGPRPCWLPDGDPAGDLVLAGDRLGSASTTAAAGPGADRARVTLHAGTGGPASAGRPTCSRATRTPSWSADGSICDVDRGGRARRAHGRGRLDDATPTAGSAARSPRTDAHLLVLSVGVRRGATAAVTGFDLVTGAEVERIPYPAGVSDVQQLHGVLVGWSSATEEISSDGPAAHGVARLLGWSPPTPVGVVTRSRRRLALGARRRGPAARGPRRVLRPVRPAPRRALLPGRGPAPRVGLPRPAGAHAADRAPRRRRRAGVARGAAPAAARSPWRWSWCCPRSTARELGGGTGAQVLTMVATGTGVVTVFAGHILSTATDRHALLGRHRLRRSCGPCRGTGRAAGSWSGCSPGSRSRTSTWSRSCSRRSSSASR